VAAFCFIHRGSLSENTVSWQTRYSGEKSRIPNRKPHSRCAVSRPDNQNALAVKCGSALVVYAQSDSAATKIAKPRCAVVFLSTALSTTECFLRQFRTP